MSFGEFTFAPRFHDRTVERQLPLQMDAGTSRRYMQDGQNAGLLLDEHDTAPSNSATLEDYIVHKPSHRRSRAWKPAELDFFAEQSNHEASSPASSAVTTSETKRSSTSTVTSQAHVQQTEDDSDLNKPKAVSELGLHATTNSSPVFDYPKWSLVGMMWRNLGKIAAAKVQAFVEAVENMRAASTDNNGTTDKVHYVRGVEDLIHQIREGASSPVLRRHTSSDNKSRPDAAAPSPLAAFKLSHAMEQAAMQTSEERRRLAQERGHLRKPDDEKFPSMQAGPLGYGGLAHNHTQLARRTGTIDSLQGQVDPAMLRAMQRQQYQNGLATESGKRTVLHDPYKEQSKNAGPLNQDAEYERHGTPLRAAEARQPNSRNLDLGQFPRILTFPESGRPLLSHLTDEQVRRMTPLVSNIRTEGPFFSADQDDQHVPKEKASYTDELDLVWFSGLRVGRQYQRVASQRLALLPEEQRNKHTEAAYRLLIPVFGQLRQYANAKRQEIKSPKVISESSPKLASWTSVGQTAPVKNEASGTAPRRGLPVPPTPLIPFASSTMSEPDSSGHKSATANMTIPTGPKSLVVKRHGKGGGGHVTAGGLRRW